MDHVLLAAVFAALPGEAAPALEDVRPALDRAAQLPRVLLIGDSISIGYTPFVQEMLAGEAVVTRVIDPETGNNGRHTRTGLARLDRWLGDEPYDVLHFNWGLWDLCYRHDPDGGRGDKAAGTLTTTLFDYETNLDQLCARMERTDAGLILATTTPVPAGEPGRFEGAAVQYNEVAGRVAAKYGLLVDDLHAHVLPRMAELQTHPNNVHFTRDGYRFLAESVVESIRTALSRRAYANLRGGLGRSARALGDGTGRVAFLGGSITHNPGWRDRVGDYLRRRFKDSEIELINAGVPSMGSLPGAYRMGRDALERGKVDLLFVEAAVNDASNGRTKLEQVRGMEGIVRRALASNPEMDIVLMHFVDPGKMDDYRAGRVPEVIESHEAVAENYQLASLNLALEVTERIDSGEFTWEDDFRDLHPSPFGQELYFRAIRDLLAEAWRRPNDRPVGAIPALDPACYQGGRLISVGEARTAAPEAGFRQIDAWRPTDGKGTRPGFVDVPMLVGDEPGASLSFPFHGNSVGIFVAAGPDVGQIEARVDDGEPITVDLFTRWSAGLHLPFSHVLAAGLDDDDHVLSLRITATKNEKSSGHAVRIAHFLVGGLVGGPTDGTVGGTSAGPSEDRSDG